MKRLRKFTKIMRFIFSIIFLVVWLIFLPIPVTLAEEDYEYQTFCGTPNRQPSNPTPAILLIGGSESSQAGEKAATQWFLKQGDRGDYLVLRFGRIKGQARWICDNFKEEINSASELVINTRYGANSQAVEDYLQGSETLFIAGGDQNKYQDIWEGTDTEDAINYLINDKKIPIAGTSAGMSILGEYYYAPAYKSVQSSEILDNPFHRNADDINRGDFLDVFILRDTITDTHLDRLDPPDYPETRYGRLMGFLARVVDDNGLPSYGIGAENGAFIAIDNQGIATVFGNGTKRGADAYFLKAETEPEIIRPDDPLIWDREGKAVKVYKISGTPQGSGKFNLNDWETAEGGQWGYWYTRLGNAGFSHCP